MTKDAVRRYLLDMRQTADRALLQEKSNAVCGKFYAMFSRRSSFLMYSPVKCEVNVLPLAEKLRLEGKRVYFPVVEDGGICFRIFEGSSEMKSGRFGIPEPKGECLDGGFDVMAVPAVAYDRLCNRLGYGGGFYDRFMASCDLCVKVGLAYDFQIVSTVYPESHDEPVDIIITENRLIRRTR